MAEEHNDKDLQLWGGIECTINRVQDVFFDQLQYSGHYHREKDIHLLSGTGITKIRYPILWEKHQPHLHHQIDWSSTEKKITELRNNGIELIAGLVHHGSGPAFTDLTDPSFPYLLADYAAGVARQFPWIEYYTPVNEPLTTARFSGLYGLWYPHKSDDAYFLKMLLHQIKGIVLSMQAIQRINPAAKLVQTEDLGKTYSTRKLKKQADFENHRRWLTYDLLCGRVTQNHPLWNYFISHGITGGELLFFQHNVCVPHIFGFNYYLTSERYLDGRLNRYPQHTHGGNGHYSYADVEAVRVELNEESGLSCLLKEAWRRYKQPIAVTEVHLHCHREDQLRWFRYAWECCTALKKEGADIVGITAWAMLGSYGWNKLLTEPAGDYEPGVFDARNGVLRPTALANFIKGLKTAAPFQHLFSDKGWWQRNDRFFHRPLLLQNTVMYTPENRSPVLIIGRNGTLGQAFAKLCKQRFLSYRLLSRQDCDIGDEAAIESAIDTCKPWAIINAAGFTRVDDAENEAGECYKANVTGPHNLAMAAARHGIKLITFSSDFVFDGKKDSPYVEQDTVNPLNVYGQTKAQSEKLVLETAPSSLVVRSSAFFGPWDDYNFLYYTRRSLQQCETVSVANDVVVSPTYVPDLVNAVLDLLMDDESGIWHLTNNGELTWADLANEVADRYKFNRKFINAVAGVALNYPAIRPAYSVLSSSRGILLPSLNNALNRYAKEAGQIAKEVLAEFRA